MIVLRIFFILVFLVILFFLFSILPRSTRRRDMLHYKGLGFAHRGLHSVYAPENSLPAFDAAVKAGIPIELDLHLTKDKRIIVFHDDNLKRMCGVDRAPEELTYSQIKLLTLEETDEPIPLFRDVLMLVAGKVPLMIELKIKGRDMELCRRADHMLRDYKGVYLIQSFNTLALQWYKKNAPQILRGQLSYDLKTKQNVLPTSLRLVTRFLVCNLYGRPDFISYRFLNRRNFALALVHFVFRCPVALWTIRNQRDYTQGMQFFDIMIFEGFIPEKEIKTHQTGFMKWRR